MTRRSSILKIRLTAAPSGPTTADRTSTSACVQEAGAHNRRIAAQPHTPEDILAWTEQIGTQSWRVRYRAGDGHTVSISGFTTQRAADNSANDIESDQRRNTCLDPTRDQTTAAEWVATWFAALDLDPRTIDNYRSMLRCHIQLRWGATPLGVITTLGVNKWGADQALVDTGADFFRAAGAAV